MKHIQKIFLAILSILVLSIYSTKAQAPLSVNNTLIVKTCSLGSYGNATISAPTEALTGDNITLGINVPATAAGCVKTVTISPSSNLNFVSSSTFPFVPATGGSFINSSVLDPINGQYMIVIFKFPNGKICDGSSGIFTVKFDVNCGGIITTCTATVSVKARAANYWTITKQYINGNLTCGVSQWQIRLNHSNPNGYGLGAYDIGGTVTEMSSPLVISPIGATAVSGSCYQWWPTIINVSLQNCKPTGTTITNTATYNLKLGDPLAPCGSPLTGTVSATSPALASPNASISFTKTAYANGNIFSNGCTGMYVLQIYNNGNVPWTGFTITDNLPPTGIVVTSYSAPTGWTIPTTYSGTVTFSNPSLVIPAGGSAAVYIYFSITVISGTVTNNATLNYHASVAGGGGTLGGCTGITCPTIDVAIKNISTTCPFTISAPKAIPSIVKCNDPYYAVPIKLVNGTIKFRTQVANGGGLPLNTVVTDALTTPQNLTIVPGSVIITYYANQYYNYCGSISGAGVSGLAYCSGNSGTASAPVFNIINLPGNCNLYQNNILVIEFDATIKPQLSGPKTNIATLTTGTTIQNANANYTIDKSGELQIRKVADVSTVEDGSNFNYNLTVSNVGSTALNNVIVTDNLPTCVQYVGPISIQKFTPPSTYTVVSGGMFAGSTATVPAAQFINPGESFIIKLPVKKLSGTNCCNPLATAVAKLIPDAIQINATTPIDQPACVKSLSCCDIKDFTASLNPTHTNGSFNLFVNAGTLPVQELEVSMLDYHVTYSNPDCKPLNMGIFGNIFSSTTTIGGLNIANNNSQSVSWGLGTPSILNGNVVITITKPAISLLDCCNGTMYFCLKIRVKNVDCKVCEKIICGRFNLKSNTVIWDANPYLIEKRELIIKPELKALNDKFNLELHQQQAIENSKIKQSIEEAIKNLDPKQAQEFLQKIKAEQPKAGVKLLREGEPLLSVPTGGTTPVPSVPK